MNIPLSFLGEALPLLTAPADPELFFTRNDPADPRLGELTGRGVVDISESTRIALIGMPQDIGVQRNGGRPGAAEAPDAIRRALYRLTPYDVENDRSLPEGLIVDLGNIHCGEDELEVIHGRLARTVELVCRAGLVPVVLGGGHDTTYPAASGVCAVHGPLGLINLDAHLDVRPPNPLRNSGTSFRMLIEEGAIEPGHLVELGIQAHANSAEHVRWVRNNGGRIITLEETRARGFARSLSTAYLIASTGVKRVYGTLDMDGVRAADAPGVSAAMPDGLAAADLLAAASLLGLRGETAGFDIVEVNPRFDRDGITAKLAAHAVVRFAVGVAARPAP